MTSQATMAAESDALSEIEVLQSIYLDELSASQKDEGGWTVSLVLYPSTAEDCLSQFVRMTLTMDLGSQYPCSPPSITIQNPRGLSDDKLLGLQKSLQSEAEACVGTPVLYQLIERAKEILTESNIPHGNCVICLYGFKEGEVFTKTRCYHYFHSHCLGRYITHSEMELKDRERELEEDKTRDRAEEEELAVICPVCREPLTYDLEALLSSPAPVFNQEDSNISGEFKKKWEALQKVLAAADLSDTPVMETTDAESTESSSSSDPVNKAAHNIRSSGQSQHQCPHYKRKPGDFFKRGGRGGGRGGAARRMMPTPGVERVGGIAHSSDKNKYVNSGSVSTAAQPSPAQGLGSDLSDKIAELRECLTKEEETAASPSRDTLEVRCGQDVNQQKECIPKETTQAILQESHSEKDVGRGEKRGSRYSGRHHAHWQERNFKASGHWDNSGTTGYRGGANRAREGGAGRYHRGGRAYRGGGGGGGRASYQRVEKEFRKEGVL
ncbi:hypothetical protein DNTS_017607 [Danionella cerebrum]|uniref:E3 ubiquitin-protein ligase RNF25 n=1 Tax=Danionella cerebrum TaxID=2873325 RepID=A0A553N3E5_9TELE|nr:hypothetical protein DNTS_017607 [Danionella translucida]